MNESDTKLNGQKYLSGARSYQQFRIGDTKIYLFGCFHRSSGHKCNPCRQPECCSIAMFIKQMIMLHRKQYPRYNASLLTEDAYHLSKTVKSRYCYYKPVDIIIKTTRYLLKKCIFDYVPVNIRVVPLFASVTLPIMCEYVKFLERQSSRSMKIEPADDVYRLLRWTLSSDFWDFMEILIFRKHSYKTIDALHGHVIDTKCKQSFDDHGSHFFYNQLMKLPVCFQRAMRSFVDNERSDYLNLNKDNSILYKLDAYRNHRIDEHDLFYLLHTACRILCLIQDIYTLLQLGAIILKGGDAYCILGEYHRETVDNFCRRDLKVQPSVSFVVSPEKDDDCIKLV